MRRAHAATRGLPRRARAAGLTLTEVMVSMGLAGIVCIAALSLTTVYSAAFSSNYAITDTQQNLWAANELVARHLRRAGLGFGMCPGGRFQRYRTGTQFQYTLVAPYATPPVYVEDNYGGKGADRLTLFYGDDPSLGSDAFVQGTPFSPGDTTFYVSSTTGISAGDFIVAWQPSVAAGSCTVFKVTGAPSAGQIPVGSDPENCPCAAGTERTQFFLNIGSYATTTTSITRLGTKLRQVQFFIDDASAEEPHLMMDRFEGPGGASSPVVVADGVEDFQVVYGCDANGDKEVTEGTSNKTNDEWYPNVASDVAPGCFDTYPDHPVKYVRFSLVTRTKTVSGTAGSFAARPALENRAAGTADGYRRRAQITTVALRNGP